MRRRAIIAATAATAVIGGGVAFGTNHHSGPEPSPIPASRIKHALRDACERGRERVLKQHPHAVVSQCNYGEGTLTTP
jgi:hypothetical protein